MPGPAGMIRTAVDGFDVVGEGVGFDAVGGCVPVAVAVFVTEPAFASACVVVYVAVHVSDAPGASELAGHEIADKVPVPVNVFSLIVTLFNVVLPVLVTLKLNVAVAPAPATDVGFTVFTRVIAGAGVGAGTVTTDGGDVTGPPVGGVPVAVAVSLT